MKHEILSSLAQLIGKEKYEVHIVNEIINFKNLCISVVARDGRGRTHHARNLDYLNSEILKKLIYQENVYKNGSIAAKLIGFGGITGAYTGLSAKGFSISYNTRGTIGKRKIKDNVDKLLDERYRSTQDVIYDALVGSDSVGEAIEFISNTKMTAPGFFIISSNQSGPNKGSPDTIITKDRDGIVNVKQLDRESEWFMISTNRDFQD